MRFTEVRRVAARPEDVWVALHDQELLSGAIPGCERLIPLGDGEYVAILTTGGDTYRALLTVADVWPGSELTVTLAGRGRCSMLEATLDIGLHHGHAPGTTSLSFDARVHICGQAHGLDPELLLAAVT
jgi:uncharacterized protein